MIVSPITKLGFGTATVLLPTVITFYKIYCGFGITIKWFVNVIYLFRILLFKSQVCFINLHNSQGGLFPTHGPELPAKSILVKTDLTRSSFKLLPFLKLILGISVNTFFCCSYGASGKWTSSKMFLMLLKAG